MEFEEVKRKFDEVKVISEKQEQRVHYYESRAQNIAMAFLIWERFCWWVVVMPHTSSFISLNCTDLWVILGFTLSSNCLYFMFFIEAVIMLNWAQNQLDVIWKEQSEICQQILNEARNSISSDGLELSFHVHVQVLETYQYPLRIVLRKVCIVITLCALLVVAAVELYFVKFLLCNSNSH